MKALAVVSELLLTYKSTISKKRFPEYSICENPTINYPEYIKTKIAEYKKEISGGLNKVIEIPIASNNRFESIINRAFGKLPPFEGKDKKSDIRMRCCGKVFWNLH